MLAWGEANMAIAHAGVAAIIGKCLSHTEFFCAEYSTLTPR